MPSCGKSHDSDFFDVYSPLCCIFPYNFDRLLSILQRTDFLIDNC